VLTTITLNNAAGLSLGLGLAVSHKAALLWANDAFDAVKVLESIARDKPTVLVILANDLKVCRV